MEATGFPPAHLAASAMLRPMTDADWPAVAAIYAEGIASGLATFETTVPSWEDFNDSRLRLCRLPDSPLPDSCTNCNA